MLLAAIAASLALVGDQAAARANAPFGAARSIGTATEAQGSGLMLATHALGALHQRVGALSDGAFEGVSLLVLGLGLIGAGQALGQKRRGRRAAGAPQREPVAPIVMTPRTPEAFGDSRRAAR